MKCLDIFLEMEELAEELSDNIAAEDYVDSVLEKARSICETVERLESESDGQVRAMENMRDGMQRWLNRG